MPNKIYDIITMSLGILIVILAATFVVCTFSGFLDFITVLACVAFAFVEWLLAYLLAYIDENERGG